MSPLFNQASVRVRVVDSNAPPRSDQIFIRVTLEEVPSQHIAKRLLEYLGAEDKVISASLSCDGEKQTADLIAAVKAKFPVDAVGYVSGLFGPQAEAFA